MIIHIDRELKITLLKALKNGYLNTLDITELYGRQLEKLNYFADILIESGIIQDNDEDTKKK